MRRRRLIGRWRRRFCCAGLWRTANSDVDMLVEFAPEHIPGLEIVDIEQELSALFSGRRVDLVNPNYLNRRLKDRVLAEAEELYAKG